MQGLISLSRKTPAEQLERAASKALHRAGWRLGHIRQALCEPPNVVQVDFLERHPLIRAMGVYRIPFPMNHPQLDPTLQQLRLSGLATTLDVRLQEAASSRLSHAEFLTLVLQDELNLRQQRRIATRSRAAGFRKPKPWRTSIGALTPRSPKSRSSSWRPASLSARPNAPCSSARPDSGKSHLSQAIGYEAIKQGFRVLRKSIFDLVRDMIAEEAMKEKE